MSKKRNLVIQIIPDNTDATKTFSISYQALRLLLYLFSMIMIIVIIFFVKFTEINMKAMSAEKLANKIKLLENKQIEIDSLKSNIEHIYDKAKIIENMTQVFLFSDSLPALEEKKKAKRVLITAQQLQAYVMRIDSIQNKQSGETSVPEHYEPFVWPVKGIITQKFKPSHNGIDIIAKLKSIVVSTANGVVVEAGWRGDLGNVVKINHGGQFTTIYAHLNKNLVRIGDHVHRGKPIGLLGSTGNSTGPHLHYEILKKNIPVNPEDFIRK